MIRYNNSIINKYLSKNKDILSKKILNVYLYRFQKYFFEYGYEYTRFKSCESMTIKPAYEQSFFGYGLQKYIYFILNKNILFTLCSLYRKFISLCNQRQSFI